jgi:hypothetical protein
MGRGRKGSERGRCCIIAYFSLTLFQSKFFRFVCSAIRGDLSFTAVIDPCMNVRMLQRHKEALGRLCAPEELQIHCTRHLR